MAGAAGRRPIVPEDRVKGMAVFQDARSARLRDVRFGKAAVHRRAGDDPRPVRPARHIAPEDAVRQIAEGPHRHPLFGDDDRPADPLLRAPVDHGQILDPGPCLAEAEDARAAALQHDLVARRGRIAAQPDRLLPNGEMRIPDLPVRGTDHARKVVDALCERDDIFFGAVREGVRERRDGRLVPVGGRRDEPVPGRNRQGHAAAEQCRAKTAWDGCAAIHCILFRHVRVLA